MRRFLLILSFAFLFNLNFAQVVYEPVENNPVYDLLDELANLKIIEINSVVRPYSREYIASKLHEARELTNSPTHQLTKRQIDEIAFYLRDYAFELGMRN